MARACSLETAAFLCLALCLLRLALRGPAGIGSVGDDVGEGGGQAQEERIKLAPSKRVSMS